MLAQPSLTQSARPNYAPEAQSPVPFLMATADVALYAAILGEIGIVPLTVTTSLNINFLRKPMATASIIGVCKLIKLGRTLAVGEVSLYSEGRSELVAHAVGTYSIPPR